MNRTNNIKVQLKTLIILLLFLLTSFCLWNSPIKDTNNSSNDNINEKNPELSMLGDAVWWNASFNYRSLINISNPYPINLVDYTISIKFNYITLVSQGKMQPNLNDARIVENGVLRKYYLANESGFATIWFETNISANSNEYDTYLYYGNNTVGKPAGYYMEDRLPQYWWRFEEGTGTNAGDSGKSTGNNNGTLRNMQSNDWVSGQVENFCLDFDGSNDYVSISSDPIPSSNAFSISLWINSRSTTGTIYDQSSGSYWNNRRFYVELDAGDINWEFEDYNNRAWTLSTPLTNPTNTWHHIVVTARWGSGSTPLNHSIWIDGQLKTSAIHNIGMKPTLNAPRIGTYRIQYLGVWTYFNGKIDDVRTYNYAIDGTHMKWLYTNYKIPAVLNEEQQKTGSIKVNVFDLYGKYIPFANISIYNETKLLQSKIGDSEGSTTFTGLIIGNYNFTVSITSNIKQGYSEIVNRTLTAVHLSELFLEINLICSVSTHIFTVKDIDGAPVESGWIIVGNNTPGFGQIQNCTIDNSGNAKFWWVNSTPYQYNYTIYYQNSIYTPNKITLTTGQISDPKIPINVNVNLTTVNFTVYRRNQPTTPIKEMDLKLYANNSQDLLIVDLITDANGKATLRWWNSSGPDVNGNYSIECIFFDKTRPFNMSVYRTEFKVDKINFTVSSKAAYNIWVDINPEDYTTELILLNPTDYIEIKWGTELEVRALFNITRAGSEPTGFTYADTMTYKVKQGETIIFSGNMPREINNTGRHQGIINTTPLEGGQAYAIEISALRTGYTAPDPLILTLLVLKNNIIVNQSENNDSPIDVYWLEIANMSIKPYGQNFEIFTIEDNIFVDDDNSFEFWIPDLSTDWNLSQIVFNLYNVMHGNNDTMQLNITDPYGIKYRWDVTNTSNYYWYSAVATNGTWIDLMIPLGKESPLFNNNFNFKIDGTFSGRAVQVSAEATFIRNKIKVEYKEFNVTNSIIIEPDGNGWAINNITFEISNCYQTSDWTLYDLTDLEALNITTNEGYKYSLKSGEEDGIGVLVIDDRKIYPFSHLSDKFLFTIENITNIVFDVHIKVEYVQEFYKNQNLEVIILTKTVPTFYSGNTFQISPNNQGWNEQNAILYINNLKNETGGLIFPSEVGMNITISDHTYTIQDGLKGTGYILLTGLSKDFILTATTQPSKLTFDLSYSISYVREVYYDITATVTYEIRGEDIIGNAPYISEFDYYGASIATSLVNADDYTIRFYASKANYNLGQKDLDLNVLERLTLLSGASGFYQQFVSIYVKDAKNYTYTYTDTIFGTKITDLDVQSYKWEYFGTGDTILQSGSGQLILNSSGDFILDFDTETRRFGRYSIILTFDKENYEIKFALVSLTINLREIDYELGKNFADKQVSVVKGKTVIIQIELTDPTKGDIPLTDAKVVLEISHEKLEFKEVDDGVYELEFDTDDYEAFFTSNTITGTIKVSKEDYITEEIDITIVITMEEVYPGIPTFYFIMIMGAIAAIAGSLATYKYIQIARIPTFVKKVRQVKKAIKSNREIEEAIIYPSKEEYMVKKLDDKYQVLGLSMENVLGIKGKKGKSISPETDSIKKKEV